MAGEKTGRTNRSLELSTIDQPQLAKEVCWQTRFRARIRQRWTDEKIDELADSLIDCAIAGDRDARKHVLAMGGVGQPITVNHTETYVDASASLADAIELALVNRGPMSFALLAAQLQTTDEEVRAAVAPWLGKRFVSAERDVVSLCTA